MAAEEDRTFDTSFEALWERLHTRLYRFVSSRVPDADEAEDIVQNVFVRIHERLESVREIDRLEGWVYQIARNSIADYYRSRRRLVELTDLPVEDEPPEPDVTASLALDIRDLVQSLPEPYRQALILTEYEGLSQQALADRMGISLSGAKSRVQRARQRIKDMLLTCCHFEFDARGLVYDYRQHCCCCEDGCATG